MVANGCECKGSKKSDQEEEDTKILLHAVDASANGATEICMHSPDTQSREVKIVAVRKKTGLIEWLPASAESGCSASVYFTCLFSSSSIN